MDNDVFIYKICKKLNIFLICVHKSKVTLNIKQMKYILGRADGKSVAICYRSNT